MKTAITLFTPSGEEFNYENVSVWQHSGDDYIVFTIPIGRIQSSLPWLVFEVPDEVKEKP